MGIVRKRLTKDELLTIRMDGELLKQLTGEAQRTGLTVSNLVRMRLLSSYGMKPVEPEGMVIRVEALDGFRHPKDKKRARAKVGT